MGPDLLEPAINLTIAECTLQNILRDKRQLKDINKIAQNALEYIYSIGIAVMSKKVAEELHNISARKGVKDSIANEAECVIQQINRHCEKYPALHINQHPDSFFEMLLEECPDIPAAPPPSGRKPCKSHPFQAFFSVRSATDDTHAESRYEKHDKQQDKLTYK